MLPDEHFLSQEFFEYYFEKHFYIERNNEFVQNLNFGIEEFENLLWYTNKIDKSKIQIRSNSESLKISKIDSSDILNIATRALTIGKSIAVNYAERFDPKIALIVRGVGEFFNCSAYSTVILTPPNSNLFKEHYDGIDVIAMQIEGEKYWRIGGFEQKLASKNYTLLSKPSKTTELHKFTKNSLAYIPRGMVHQVSTQKTYSLHISIGLHLNRKLDIYLENLKSLEDDYLGLRKSHKVNLIINGNKEFSDDLRILKNILTPINIEKSIERLNSGRYSQLEVLPDEKLKNTLHLSSVSPESIVEKYKGMPISFTINDNSILLSFPMSLSDEDQWKYKAITLPMILLPTAKFLKETNSPFLIKDLPGLLDSESKLLLIRELINYNLLKCI